MFNKDEMLDNIMLYWLTNSGASSARYYWECKVLSTAWPIDIPVGVSWFAGDITYGPREWCERYYKNIVYWKEVERGDILRHGRCRIFLSRRYGSGGGRLGDGRRCRRGSWFKKYSRVSFRSSIHLFTRKNFLEYIVLSLEHLILSCYSEQPG